MIFGLPKVTLSRFILRCKRDTSIVGMFSSIPSMRSVDLCLFQLTA